MLARPIANSPEPWGCRACLVTWENSALISSSDCHAHVMYPNSFNSVCVQIFSTCFLETLLSQNPPNDSEELQACRSALRTLQGMMEVYNVA